MQDTPIAASSERGILTWAGIAVTCLALVRPMGQLLSWIVRHLFLLPLENRLDRVEATAKRTQDSVEELHPKIDELSDSQRAMARALQRMEVRRAHDDPSAQRESTLASDPDFPMQVSAGREAA